MLSTAKYVGLLNVADRPAPFAAPATPDPAIVVTVPTMDPGPLFVIFRILWFDLSATYTFPAPSTATPLGLLNEATKEPSI